MSFWKRLLGIKEKAPEPAPDVARGQAWQLVHNEPWPRPAGYGVVNVLDVADGWVRYTFGPGLFSDCRMEAPTFCKVYRRLP